MPLALTEQKISSHDAVDRRDVDSRDVDSPALQGAQGS
jgi:hypothetical protein